MIDVSDDDMDRREHFRLDMEKELIDIQWVNEKGEAQNKKIICVDFSRGGLKVDCDHSIPLHTEVTVIFRQAHPKSQTLTGRVLRCLKQKNGWFEIALLLDDKP